MLKMVKKVNKLELDGASKQGANPFGQFQLTNGMNNQQMQDFNQNLYSQNNQDIVNPFNDYPINNPFAGMQNSQSNAPLDFSFVRYGERKGY